MDDHQRRSSGSLHRKLTRIFIVLFCINHLSDDSYRQPIRSSIRLAEAGSKSSSKATKTTVIAISGGGGGKPHPVPVPWPVVHCHHHHHHLKYVPKPVLVHHWVRKFKPYEEAESSSHENSMLPPMAGSMPIPLMMPQHQHPYQSHQQLPPTHQLNGPPGGGHYQMLDQEQQQQQQLFGPQQQAAAASFNPLNIDLNQLPLDMDDTGQQAALLSAADGSGGNGGNINNNNNNHNLLLPPESMLNDEPPQFATSQQFQQAAKSQHQHQPKFASPSKFLSDDLLLNMGERHPTLGFGSKLTSGGVGVGTHLAPLAGKQLAKLRQTIRSAAGQRLKTSASSSFTVDKRPNASQLPSIDTDSDDSLKNVALANISSTFLDMDGKSANLIDFDHQPPTNGQQQLLEGNNGINSNNINNNNNNNGTSFVGNDFSDSLKILSSNLIGETNQFADLYQAQPDGTTLVHSTSAPSQPNRGAAKPSHPFEGDQFHDQLHDESTTTTRQRPTLGSAANKHPSGSNSNNNNNHNNNHSHRNSRPSLQHQKQSIDLELNKLNQKEEMEALKSLERVSVDRANRLTALTAFNRQHQLAGGQPGLATGNRHALRQQQQHPKQQVNPVVVAATSPPPPPSMLLSGNPVMSARAATSISESQTIDLMTQLAERMAQIKLKNLIEKQAQLLQGNGSSSSGSSRDSTRDSKQTGPQQQQQQQTKTSRSLLAQINPMSLFGGASLRGKRRMGENYQRSSPAPMNVDTDKRVKTLMHLQANQQQQQQQQQLTLNNWSSRRHQVAPNNNNNNVITASPLNLNYVLPSLQSSAARLYRSQHGAANQAASSRFLANSANPKVTRQQPSQHQDPLMPEASSLGNKIVDPQSAPAPALAAPPAATVTTANGSDQSASEQQVAALNQRYKQDIVYKTHPRSAPVANSTVTTTTTKLPTAEQTAGQAKDSTKILSGNNIAPQSSNNVIKPTVNNNVVGAQTTNSIMSPEQEIRFYNGQREHLTKAQVAAADIGATKLLHYTPTVSSSIVSNNNNNKQNPNFRFYTPQSSNVQESIVNPNQPLESSYQQMGLNNDELQPMQQQQQQSLLQADQPGDQQQASLQTNGQMLHLFGDMPETLQQQQQQQQASSMSQLGPEQMASYLEFPMSPQQWSSEALKSMNSNQQSEMLFAQQQQQQQQQLQLQPSEQSANEQQSAYAANTNQLVEADYSAGGPSDQQHQVGQDQQGQANVDLASHYEQAVYDQQVPAANTRDKMLLTLNGQLFGGGQQHQHQPATAFNQLHHSSSSMQPHGFYMTGQPIGAGQTLASPLQSSIFSPPLQSSMGQFNFDATQAAASAGGGAGLSLFPQPTNIQQYHQHLQQQQHQGPQAFFNMNNNAAFAVSGGGGGGSGGYQMSPMASNVVPFAQSNTMIPATANINEMLTNFNQVNYQAPVLTPKSAKKLTNAANKQAGARQKGLKGFKGFSGWINNNNNNNQQLSPLNQLDDSLQTATNDMNQLRQFSSALGGTGNAGFTGQASPFGLGGGHNYTGTGTGTSTFASQLRTQAQNLQARLPQMPQMPNIPNAPQIPNLPMPPPGMMQMAGLALPFAMARATRQSNRFRNNQVNAAASQGGHAQTSAGQRLIQGATNLTNRLVRSRRQRRPTTSSPTNSLASKSSGAGATGATAAAASAASAAATSFLRAPAAGLLAGRRPPQPAQVFRLLRTMADLGQRHAGARRPLVASGGGVRFKPGGASNLINVAVSAAGPLVASAAASKASSASSASSSPGQSIRIAAASAVLSSAAAAATGGSSSASSKTIKPKMDTERSDHLAGHALTYRSQPNIGDILRSTAAAASSSSVAPQGQHLATRASRSLSGASKDGRPALPSGVGRLAASERLAIPAVRTDGSVARFASMTSPLDMWARQLHKQQASQRQLGPLARSERPLIAYGANQLQELGQQQFTMATEDDLHPGQHRQQQPAAYSTSELMYDLNSMYANHSVDDLMRLNPNLMGPHEGAQTLERAKQQEATVNRELVTTNTMNRRLVGDQLQQQQQQHSKQHHGLPPVPLVANHINLMLFTAQNVTGNLLRPRHQEATTRAPINREPEQQDRQVNYQQVDQVEAMGQQQVAAAQDSGQYIGGRERPADADDDLRYASAIGEQDDNKKVQSQYYGQAMMESPAFDSQPLVFEPALSPTTTTTTSQTAPSESQFELITAPTQSSPTLGELATMMTTTTTAAPTTTIFETTTIPTTTTTTTTTAASTTAATTSKAPTLRRHDDISRFTPITESSLSSSGWTPSLAKESNLITRTSHMLATQLGKIKRSTPSPKPLASGGNPERRLDQWGQAEESRVVVDLPAKFSPAPGFQTSGRPKTTPVMGHHKYTSKPSTTTTTTTTTTSASTTTRVNQETTTMAPLTTTPVALTKITQGASKAAPAAASPMVADYVRAIKLVRGVAYPWPPPTKGSSMLFQPSDGLDSLQQDYLEQTLVGVQTRT